jgi:thiamine pyrophosphate-dependent acetolactate synthase large subunit-like protein
VPAAPGPLTVADVAAALRVAVADVPVSLVRVPHGWGGELWDVAHPLDFLGADGGEGVGSGIGMAIGAALALRATDRIAVAVLGDGDYLMGVNGLWTAAHYELGALIVVANNRSFFNDEIHQHRVAVRRERPVENAWIGQRIDDPEPSLVQLAVAQGVAGYGPVDDRTALADALTVALERVRAGAPAVVDVHTVSSVASETARAATQTERG